MEKKKILLKITDVKKYFPVKKVGLLQKQTLYVKANDGISIDIYEGETLGLVGESGCGKSTLGRLLLKLCSQTDGRVMYYGRTCQEVRPRYIKCLIKKLEKVKCADKEHNSDYVSLFGGLIKADDPGAVAKAYLDEYNAGVKLSALKQKKRLLQIRKKSAANDKKLLALESKTAREEKRWSDFSERIDRMRAQYSGDREFMELEALRDDGIDLSRLTQSEMRVLRKDMQIIFQDPYSSLNPRMTAGQIIEESLAAHQIYRKSSESMEAFVQQVMEECGLAPYMMRRYPHQFSGGQRQRISVARALALRPRFVVCDEPVSALDVSIQSQIINLLQDLKEQLNLTYLFISHDLSVVKYISDRIGVMYLGNIVELGDTEGLFHSPGHPYTQALLSAIPTTGTAADKETIWLEGDIPSPVDPPSGCKFHTRCKYAATVCRERPPLWEEVAPGHFVACHHKGNLNVNKGSGD